MTEAAVVIANRIERWIPPELATPVTIRVIPQSVCFLSHPAKPEHRLQLDADDRGLVRFHARALKGAESTEFHLECHGRGGEIELHTISLGADSRAVGWTGGPEQAMERVVRGEVRPALQGDLMAPSNEELVAKGYPPRPDPGTSPMQYERWLSNVSRSWKQVSSRRVAHPEYGHVRREECEEKDAQAQGLSRKAVASRTVNHDNSHWCGAYYSHPAKQFAHIQADWNVPLVVDLPNGPGFSAVVQWIGLDNAGGDLYQAGTGSECLTVLGFQITTYFLWMETLPWSWSEIPNFQVFPGDQISVDIFVANSSDTTVDQDGPSDWPTLHDNNVWFLVNNATSGASFVGSYTAGAESLFGLESAGSKGRKAEFILERPSINGRLAPLALFLGPALMTSCAYGDVEDGELNTLPLGSDAGISPFDGRLTHLNMVDPSNNHPLAFALAIPDPNDTADAQAILFGWQNFE